MAETLDEAALGQWLTGNVAGFTMASSGPFSLRKFPGGQSNPTYLIETGSQNYVLRRKPFGVLLASAHAIEREYRLISALYPAGFPTAQPLALCEEASVIGSAFYVMGHLDGDGYWDGALPGKTQSERRRLYEARPTLWRPCIL
jgi:aminoglycoside phosphotransferase (APT) family kinase protein